MKPFVQWVKKCNLSHRIEVCFAASTRSLTKYAEAFQCHVYFLNTWGISMNTIVVSFLGRDCPGVVHTVSSLLTGLECNIEEVSQTILKQEFAAIFIVSKPEGLDLDTMHRVLTVGIADKDMDLTVTIRPFDGGCWKNPIEESEPFVLTVDGPDSPGLIAEMTQILGEHLVNIENLKAIRPEETPERALIVYEVTLPMSLDRAVLRSLLQNKARELGVQVSLQHSDIFEAVHRVLPV